MVSSVVFLPQSLVFGQYVTITITTTATEQVYNQPFDLTGTYIDWGTNTRICSLQYYPDSGVSLSAGDTLTGEITSNNPVYLAIVTTGYATAKGQGGCTGLLGTQLYSASVYPAKPLQFQWTATSSATYYVALLNGPNEAQGSLSINRVYVTQQQQYSQVYTPASSSVTSTPSLQMPQPPQATANPIQSNPLVAIVIAVTAAVALVALILYTTRKRKSEIAETKTVRQQRRSETKKTGRNFCIECGSELPLKSKFCNNCGTKQP